MVDVTRLDIDRICNPEILQNVFDNNVFKNVNLFYSYVKNNKAKYSKTH